MYNALLYNDKNCDIFTIKASACEIYVVENTSKKKIKKEMTCG